MKRIGACVLATVLMAFAPAVAHAATPSVAPTVRVAAAAAASPAVITPDTVDYQYRYQYWCNTDGSMSLNFKLTDNTGKIDKFTEVVTVEYQTSDGVWHVATYPDGSPDKDTQSSGVITPAVGSHFAQQYSMPTGSSYWQAVHATRFGFRLQGNWFVANGSSQNRVAWIHGKVIPSCPVS